MKNSLPSGSELSAAPTVGQSAIKLATAQSSVLRLERQYRVRR
ncbi:hypothetical protein [Propionivibrio sp.]|nr:hypothetical protein [Propionivibrio sp.]